MFKVRTKSIEFNANEVKKIADYDPTRVSVVFFEGSSSRDFKIGGSDLSAANGFPLPSYSGQSGGNTYSTTEILRFDGTASTAEFWATTENGNTLNVLEIYND